MTYYHPHQPRSQDDWLLPAVDTKNVTDISIPKPAPADAFNYNPSPVSSGNWPSPAQPFRQSVDLVPHSTLQNHQDCTQIGTPTSIDDYQMNDCEARPPYASGANLSYTGSSTMHRPHQPSPISLPSSYSPVPRLSASGSPKVTLGEPPHQMPSLKVEAHDPVVPSLPGSRDSSTGPKKSAESSASKKDEPYAKLIEKALRSRADYSMQLQEIYQWFLENTDKARSFQSQPKDSVGKGWQNSIRHNLSMNAVSPIPALHVFSLLPQRAIGFSAHICHAACLRQAPQYMAGGGGQAERLISIHSCILNQSANSTFLLAGFHKER